MINYGDLYRPMLPTVIRRNNVFNAFAIAKAAVHRSMRDAYSGSNVYAHHFLSKVVKRACDSAVCLLCLACRPSAVVGAVPKLIIYAVERVSGSRALAHVAQECFKGIPLSAVCDAAQRIVFGAFQLGVGASDSHTNPYPVLWRKRATMSAMTCGLHVPLKAPT
jgi:hypothetical protein